MNKITKERRTKKMTKYTKKQKSEYFRNLRNEWKKSKELAKNDEAGKALHREAGNGTSYYSFMFTLYAMKEYGYDGLPYIDCKTFRGWKNSGFTVKKGQKAKINGMVWIKPTIKDENGQKIENDDDRVVYPKVYKLFHKSQVQAI